MYTHLYPAFKIVADKLHSLLYTATDSKITELKNVPPCVNNSPQKRRPKHNTYQPNCYCTATLLWNVKSCDLLTAVDRHTSHTRKTIMETNYNDMIANRS